MLSAVVGTIVFLLVPLAVEVLLSPPACLLLLMAPARRKNRADQALQRASSTTRLQQTIPRYAPASPSALARPGAGSDPLATAPVPAVDGHAAVAA